MVSGFRQRRGTGAPADSAAKQADPVTQYFTALNEGDTHLLENVWPGEVVIYDPRAGEVRGHKQLRQFVGRNQSWQAGRNVRIETVATTSAGGRAVVELLAHLDDESDEQAWPVAVVAESPDDLSVVFRTYCSQWPVAGGARSGLPSSSPGPSIRVAWSAATRRRSTPATSKRS